MYKYLRLFSFLFLLFESLPSFAFSTWWQSSLYYCPDDAVIMWGGGMETEWGWAKDYSSPSHPYDATMCILRPTPVVCSSPLIRDSNVTSSTYNTCISDTSVKMYNCPDGLTTVDSLSKCPNSVACLDGTTVFSPATCPTNSWSFWTLVPTTPTVCPTGETICACDPYWSASTCGDLQLKKFALDWADKNKALAGLAGFALGTTRIVNPSLLFQGEKLLMDGKLITNGGNLFKVTELQAEVPGAVRNSALIEYMGSNPSSSLTTNVISAASSQFGNVVPYSGGLAVADGLGGYAPLSANQIGSIVDSNHLLSTSFSDLNQAATAIQPYFKYGSVPTFTAAVDAIEGDFKRIYDSDPKTQPLYFPVTNSATYTNDASLATAPKMATLSVSAPLSYSFPITSTSTTTTPTTYNSTQTSTATTTATTTNTSTTTQTTTDTVVVSPLPGLPDVDSIEATNNRIFNAFSGFLAPFDSLRSAVSCDLNCPTATFSLWGRDLVMDYHCILFADIRPILHIVMLAVWALSGLYIILKA